MSINSKAIINEDLDSLWEEAVLESGGIGLGGFLWL